MQHTKKGYIIQHYGSMSIKSNSMATHWNIPVSLSTNMMQTNSSARPGLQGRDIPVNYQQHRVKLQWLGCWLEGRISCPGFFLLSIFRCFYSLHFPGPWVGIQALFILLASAVLAAAGAHGQTVWMSLGRDVEALRLSSDNASVNVIIVLENAICAGSYILFYFFPERCAD